MHLKNFSLIQHPGNGHILSATYDLVATALVNLADDEDLALTLNGKKKKIKKTDFSSALYTLKLEAKKQENFFSKTEKDNAKWMDFIDNCFISNDFKVALETLINKSFERL